MDLECTWLRATGHSVYVTVSCRCSRGYLGGRFSIRKIFLLQNGPSFPQGSFIENKGSALVWQYRDSDPEFGMMQCKELSTYLREFLFGYPIEVLTGKGYLEVGRTTTGLFRSLGGATVLFHVVGGGTNYTKFSDVLTVVLAAHAAHHTTVT